MKKKILITILTICLITGNGITAFAAPQIMGDGTWFDAEYYAQENPDVAAVLGTDAEVLYQHYKNYGMAEGRKPVDENTLAALQNVNPTSVQNIEPTGDYNVGSVYGPKLTKKELNEVKEAVKAFLASYDFSTMDDYTKAETAYDYLTRTCSYAPDWSRNRANTAWGALVYHEAQCSGYARAMKALCDAMGLGCYYVHADANAINPDHQWNEVCVDGKWYIADACINEGSRVLFLISDDIYASMTGMSWNRSIVPACPEIYGDRYYFQVGNQWFVF